VDATAGVVVAAAQGVWKNMLDRRLWYTGRRWYISSWKQHARKLKTETYALYLAYRDPRTPWHARLFAACVVGYAFSPIDLIPDFIPVLGYLDDLILVPLGIALALKLVPANVMAECRAQAQAEGDADRPAGRLAALVIVGVWLLLAGLAIVLVARAF
jgi:uncharacterized membrane protein YkvA (DUF1232 family)